MPAEAKMVDKKTAYQTCLGVVKNELTASVLVDKYLLCKTIDEKNANYVETTPQEMWRRLAVANAQAEKPENRERFAEQVYAAQEDFKFTGAGRILYGLGNPFVHVTLKNCYIFKVQEDSMKGIFDIGYWMAETYKGGGGCGVNISTLRPKNSPVNNAARIAGGAVGFMDFFSHITGMIGQMGRIGALLLALDVDHPDVEDFIKIKGGDDLNKVRYANISVMITDEFMNALVDDRDFNLRWNGRVYRTIRAKDLWNLIQQFAWKRAEPGILFIDSMIRGCPSGMYDQFKPVATNPCGEVAAGHGDSCDLGSINLGKYVRNSWFNPYFDYEAFKSDVRTAIRFLDNINTLEKTPLLFQQKINDEGRRVGLGVMGLADVFMRMSMRYDSDAALELAENIFKVMRDTAYDESCNLAEEKGPFPAFDVEKHMKSPFIQRLPDYLKERIKKKGIRNIAVLSIAPTGSIAVVAQASSGIEPAFKIHYIRKTNLGTAKEVKEHEVWHATAKEYSEKFNCPSDKLPDFFVGAHQVDNDRRLRLQAVIQKYVDQSISNTFNLPHDATPEQIGKLYISAWRLGLKGITVYRDGSREGVLVDIPSVKEEKQHIVVHSAPSRPKVLDAKVHIIKPNGKTFTVFVGFMDGRIYEVFALDHKLAGVADGQTGQIVKEKGENDLNFYHFESGAMRIQKLNSYEDNEASLFTRLVSTSLRHGVPLEFIVDQISKSRALITSFPKAIAKTLAIYIKQEELRGKFRCKKCGSDDIQMGATCKTCRNCGESLCG